MIGAFLCVLFLLQLPMPSFFIPQSSKFLDALVDPFRSIWEQFLYRDGIVDFDWSLPGRPGVVANILRDFGWEIFAGVRRADAGPDPLNLGAIERDASVRIERSCR